MFSVQSIASCSGIKQSYMKDCKIYGDLDSKLDYLIRLLEEKQPIPETARKPMGLRETADYLNLTAQGVYNRVHQGTIPYHKNGKLYFYQDELDAFIDGSWIPNSKTKKSRSVPQLTNS